MQNQFILSCIKIDLKPHPRAPADAFIYGVPCAEDSILCTKSKQVIILRFPTFAVFRIHISTHLDRLFFSSDFLFRYGKRIKNVERFKVTIISIHVWNEGLCTLDQDSCEKCPVSVFSQEVQEVLHLIIKECLILRALGKLLFYLRLY